MFDLLDFISEYRVIKGVPTNTFSMEPYITEFGYEVSNNSCNLILSSRLVGTTTLLKSTATYYLMNGKNVIFIDNDRKSCGWFIRDVKAQIIYLNELYNNIGLYHEEINKVRDGKFRLEVNDNKLIVATKPDDLRGFNLEETVILFDNSFANNDFYRFLTIIFTGRPYKTIINSCNSFNISDFHDLYHNTDENYKYWNRIKLDCYSNSRIASKEKQILGVYGEEEFNRVFALK